VNEDVIHKTQPDVMLILSWNIRDEIVEQITYIREWGGKFAVPAQELQILFPEEDISYHTRHQSLHFLLQ